MLNIKNKTNGTELTVTLEGKLDTTTAPQLEKEIEKAVEKADSVVFDMKGLKYISSAGLRTILLLHKKMAKKGGLIIRNADESIIEIFDFTGFTDILNIE